MPRAPNFTYQNPIGDIGSGLVRAIFGDPQMAAQQRQMQSRAALEEAQREEALSHSAVYNTQAQGHNIANSAREGLPGLFEQFGLSNGPAPAAPTVDSPGFADFSTPFAAPVDTRPDHTLALGNLIAGMGQIQGDKLDPTKLMGAYGGFYGSDPMGRAAIIAQGNTPGKDFAIDASRADQIAANDAAAKEHSAFGVATINHASDMPIARLQSSDRRYATNTESGDRRYATDTSSGDRRYATDAKSAGPAPSFTAIQSVFPGVRMNSGLRTPEHNREVGGVSNSYHLGQAPGTQAYDIDAQAGVTVEQAAAAIEAKNPNVRVIEARDEAGRVGPNGKALGGWHFTLQNIGGPAAKPPKPPKPVKAADAKMVNAVLDGPTYGINRFDPADQASIREDALSIYQQTGNPEQAARKAFVNFSVHRREITGKQIPGDPTYANPNAAPKPAPRAAPRAVQPPVAGAKQAPDGKWYVKQGNKFFRVDG